MKRSIITIDEDRCVGCGMCASACHQGAIGIVDGKAKLLREDHCDGLGRCLPVCPMEAISFEEREVETVVTERSEIENGQSDTLTCLNQWPVQIKLVPSNAPYFDNADLLIASDCTAYAYGNFHEKYMRGKITIIGCPKLDDGDYTDKLTAILAKNEIKSATVVRMEVPCCSGMEYATKRALGNNEKMIPCQVITISTDGRIIENERRD